MVLHLRPVHCHSRPFMKSGELLISDMRSQMLPSEITCLAGWKEPAGQLARRCSWLGPAPAG